MHLFTHSDIENIYGEWKAKCGPHSSVKIHLWIYLIHIPIWGSMWKPSSFAIILERQWYRKQEK